MVRAFKSIARASLAPKLASWPDTGQPTERRRSIARGGSSSQLLIRIVCQQATIAKASVSFILPTGSQRHECRGAHRPRRAARVRRGVS